MPARVALALGGKSDRDYAEILAAARLAEDRGYEAVFVSETWGRDAFTTLAALARDTTRVRLGTGIVNVFSRSPAVLAMAAASVDEIARGRMILGLGTSGERVIERWHGIANERPLPRLAETVETVRAILSGAKRDTFALKIAPRPVPIWVASLTPAGLALAGRLADGWMGYFSGPASGADDRARVERALAASGRPRSAFTMAPYVYAAVADDLAEARAVLRRHIAFYVGSMGRFYREQLARHGHREVGDEIVRLVAERRGDEARALVTDELVDEYALVGPEARVRERLDDYRDAGVDLPIVALPDGLTPDQVGRTIRAFGP
jgi:alkanesulfonate monooxygenase SsuD/methylene tetrahydromethanopterin reductase-like flavin-dependent oxidoreductase (luciferase family)